MEVCGVVRPELRRSCRTWPWCRGSRSRARPGAPCRWTRAPARRPHPAASGTQCGRFLQRGKTSPADAWEGRGQGERASTKHPQTHPPVRMFWKACSTLVASSADVSMKDSPFFSVGGGRVCYAQERVQRRNRLPSQHTPAKLLASSVGTARRWRRSHLLPTSMITMLLSAWSLPCGWVDGREGC